MADLDRITLPSGTTYTLKDAVARSLIANLNGYTAFVGVSTTVLTDGSTVNPIVVDGQNVQAVAGNIATYGSGEFIFNGTSWQAFGDLSGLGALAYKNSATGNYTPAGSVSAPIFTGGVSTSTGTFTPTGTVSRPTFTGSEGTVSVSATPTGSISVGNGTANYTPSGTISQPTVSVDLATTSKFVAASANGGGSVSAGSAASCVLPQLTMTVQNETLTIGWAQGSFTPNTPTSVTLPTFTQQTIATGVDTASVSRPTFTGDGAELKFTGNGLTATGAFTPSGSVSQPTFTGDAGNVSVSGTATGSVSQPTFSGTIGSVTVQ